jgi:hypothetical protein
LGELKIDTSPKLSLMKTSAGKRDAAREQVLYRYGSGFIETPRHARTTDKRQRCWQLVPSFLPSLL